MTILTKPNLSEKKPEKITALIGSQDDVAMLHGGTTLLNHPPSSYANSNVDAESMVFNRGPQFSCIKSVLLFLISLIVMMMGILGGYTLYRMYAPSHGSMHYRALCDVPYSTNNNLTFPRFYARPDDFELQWRNFLPRFTNSDDNAFGAVMDDNFFREEIELDMTDAESYAKIDVPDFKDGRRGRFIHDFKENQSAIIDTMNNRCFVMQLDRDTTLPPKSFLDLMEKMGTGYYNIDTDRVRRTMRVVTPPISDLSLISGRIANECFDMKVYMLENYISGVFKREARPMTEAGKFAEFLGKGIVEFDLMNIADIEEFERKQQK